MSEQAKHTPWHANTVEEGHPANDQGVSVRDADGNVVAVVFGYRKAKLIAAAPAMREALRAIIARAEGAWDAPELVAFGPLTTDTAADMTAIARAALALAEAKES